MSDEHEYDDLAEDLHAMRAEPRPEFAHELDERAAEWLRERPRRRLPSPRIALRLAAAAASAAALVVALVIASGDGEDAKPLDVAVVSEGIPGAGQAPSPMQTPTPRQAPEALDAAPQPDSAQRGGGGAFLLTTVEGDTVTVRYLFPAAAPAKVELAGREAEVTVGPGAGSLEISTEGLPPGGHELMISAPPAPPYRERVDVRR